MNLGPALVQTMRHFFPALNTGLDRLPDTRDQDARIDERRFLAGWGSALYVFQLGSRRQLDFDLQATGTHVLTNLHRVAGTAQTTRPVHDTRDSFLGHTQASAIATVRPPMVRRLLRMKVLDAARLHGELVLLVDGTGLLCGRRPPCDHGLGQRRRSGPLYLHNVLEAKLLGPAGVVVSIGSEFIDNSAAQEAVGQGPRRSSRRVS